MLQIARFAALALVVVIAAPTSVASFSWPGTYDLVGSGFPDGNRHAVMHVERRDSSYTLEMLEGPPGELIAFRVSGDSAHVVWSMSGPVMAVALHGVRDSVYGRWSIDERSGSIVGVRRRGQ
ncbi:MAG TPA: hypothetical protein VFZ21_14770 [Gemmatimonadaceae bacterium]|jgi:hypothetical protein|nr:hypothetical protein [Gemmatimonadaceae bacterium]